MSIVVKLPRSTGGVTSTATSITMTNKVETQSRRLDALLDVEEAADLPAGSTLVYDPVTDKYVVKLLDLDGGSF